MTRKRPLAVRSTRVVTPRGVAPATILVRDGTIVAVGDYDDTPKDAELLDEGDAAILPGLVDTHVHINEPGRGEWEGFETATRAAAAGGVTTVVEMPLNATPPTTTVEGLRLKAQCARGKLAVDVGFWGGLVPDNLAELRPLWEAGVFGFKCFLVPSGVEEFPPVGEGELGAALPVLAGLGAPLLVHAEAPGPIEASLELQASLTWESRRYACYLATRPRVAEHQAIALLLRLADRWGGRIHIVHLSAADAAPMLAAARAAGLAVTVETCPHYLRFAAEDVPDGATEYKCAPPIRERDNREALWRALGEGVIDLVASDHSPCPPDLKRRGSGDFLQAWGGIASLQVALPAVWTDARSRGFALSDLARWMSAAPALLAGLERKGAIAPGRDADLVAFLPEAERLVEPAKLEHRHPLTPYAGALLTGVVERTWLRGSLVYDRGVFVSPPAGRVLRRGDA